MSRLFYENKKSKFYKTKMFAPLVQGPGYAIESLYTIYTKFYKTKMFAPLVQGPGYAIESLYTIYT